MARSIRDRHLRGCQELESLKSKAESAHAHHDLKLRSILSSYFVADDGGPGELALIRTAKEKLREGNKSGGQRGEVYSYEGRDYTWSGLLDIAKAFGLSSRTLRRYETIEKRTAQMVPLIKAKACTLAQAENAAKYGRNHPSGPFRELDRGTIGLLDEFEIWCVSGPPNNPTPVTQKTAFIHRYEMTLISLSWCILSL